jgi:hypothetical protein
MSDKPDHEHGIYRVLHTIKVGGNWLTGISDLIFLEGDPYIVLEWGGTPENQRPEVTQKLDPARLSKDLSGSADFLYDGPVEDPRSVQ